MNFLESFQTCYKKIFNYRGRASKSEYWWFQLYYTLFAILTSYFQDHSFGQGLIYLWLFNTLPCLSAGFRRLHDINKSGWWLLLSLTVIGIIPIIYWACKKGDEKENRFGKNPLSN